MAMPELAITALVIFSYLAGGIPTGYLVVKRLKGLDIRKHGSGNPGTANVYRVAGARAGLITLMMDALKGFLPVMIARLLYPNGPELMILCGGAAIVGHDWTPFLGFSGGKGVATSAGVFAAMAPSALICAAVVFITAVRLSRHISIGSMAGAACLPAFNWLWGSGPAVVAASAAASTLILYKHIPNMKRLLHKEELLFHGKKY
ncbi:MAG: glycerol-3-phosphate 1-O-acyltransferase PlsY [Elusimicrobia bacterium]|nr:glycerol-3-phosphate 1-O-acyltransferase PlsY [Elusimicrobiota bacterium]